MYLLLPQLVARDQAGVGEAVAEHFATAAAWDRVLHARVGAGARAAWSAGWAACGPCGCHV